MAKGKHLKRRTENKVKTRRIFLIILVIIFIFSITTVIFRLSNSYKNKKENDNLKNTITNIQTSNTERIEKVKELKEENQDIIGWLEIENTNISYPVLQGEDNSFYMTHNYKKEYSKDGSLFLDKDYDWKLPSTNLLIYGHNNIGSNEMFASLMNYKEESYYNDHKIIRFTTNTEDAEYEIISVFLSRVYYKSEKDVFRYYYFINANNEEEFNKYIENSKKASLYNIEATSTYGDQLITLSTCSYHTEDGRLAIVARKI